MKVFVDTKEEDVVFSNYRTVKELYSFFQERLKAQDRLIYKIEVDDQEKKVAELASLELKDIDTLRFLTKEKDQVFNDALKEIVANLPGLVRTLNSVVSALRRAEEKKAFEDYLKALPLISAIILGLRAVEMELGKEFRLDYPALITCFENINDAYTNQDTILLADSLEYEFLPWLENMARIVSPEIK